MNIFLLLNYALITYIVYIGIRESKKANNIMVMIKLAVILLVIIAGAFYVSPGKLSPLYAKWVQRCNERGIGVIFCNIGLMLFQQQLRNVKTHKGTFPGLCSIHCSFVRGCTLLLFLLSQALTSYSNFNPNRVRIHLHLFLDSNSKVSIFIAGIISVSAMMSLPRVAGLSIRSTGIWMSMSRDGYYTDFCAYSSNIKLLLFLLFLPALWWVYPLSFPDLDVGNCSHKYRTLFALYWCAVGYSFYKAAQTGRK